MTVESELQEEDNGGGGGGGGGSKFRFPPPRKTPPGRRPPPGRPIAKPKGEVNQGEKAPDADAESGGSSE